MSADALAAAKFAPASRPRSEKVAPERGAAATLALKRKL
jgi:hypothetical protein